MLNDLHPSEGDQWDRVASELRAAREAQRRDYGDLDAATLGRWLAGEASDGEQAQVESALVDRPQLRQLADLVKDVLDGLDSVSLDPTPLSLPVTVPRPQTLPFRRRVPRRASFFWNRAAMAAAACLMAALGLGLAGAGSPAPGFAASEAVAFAPPAGGEARKGFVGLDAMVGPEAVRVAMASPETSPRVRAHARRRVFRQVSSLTYAGQQAGRRGEFEKATSLYREAQRVCKQHNISEHHPASANAIHGEARLLQLALNEPPAAKADDSGTVASRTSEYARPDPIVLRERLARKSIGALRTDEVPVLSAAFRNAATPEDRQAYAVALGKVGPAACSAVRSLATRLVRTEDAAEKQAVLQALRAVGPSARQELVAWLDERPLLGSRGTEKGTPRKKWAEPRPLTAKEKEKVREAVAALADDLYAVGVQDTAGRCTVRVASRATEKLRGLARSHRAEVLVETVAGDARRDSVRCLDCLGKRAVYVALCPATKKATLHVSDALIREAFPVARVTASLDAALAAGGCDQAVSELPRLLDAVLPR